MLISHNDLTLEGTREPSGFTANTRIKVSTGTDIIRSLLEAQQQTNRVLECRSLLEAQQQTNRVLECRGLLEAQQQTNRVLECRGLLEVQQQTNRVLECRSLLEAQQQTNRVLECRSLLEAQQQTNRVLECRGLLEAQQQTNRVLECRSLLEAQQQTNRVLECRGLLEAQQQTNRVLECRGLLEAQQQTNRVLECRGLLEAQQQTNRVLECRGLLEAQQQTNRVLECRGLLEAQQQTNRVLECRGLLEAQQQTNRVLECRSLLEVQQQTNRVLECRGLLEAQQQTNSVLECRGLLEAVTPVDGSKTWGRSSVLKKEEVTSTKKKGRTWGPSSTQQKERVGGEERLKSLGEGNKQWSSSAPNLGKSPKHTPISGGFASLTEMEEYADSDGSVPQSPYSTQSYLTLPPQLDIRTNQQEDLGLSAASSSDSPKRGSQSRRKSELVLLGCASLLAAVALGGDLTEMVPQEEKKKGIFHWAGRGPRRRASSPTRCMSRGEDLVVPPSSVTLISLSSISDCNSTRSLIRSDSDDFTLDQDNIPRGRGEKEMEPQGDFGNNPLVDYKVESFKRDPRQSITPTHVTAARTSTTTTIRGHRRTPSDGVIRQVTQGHRRSPSDGSTPQLNDTGSKDPFPFPRLPDPNFLFPPPARRKSPEKDSAVERPTSLEFAPRPRPSASRPRLDPWKFVSLSRTQSLSPPSGGGDASSSGSGEGLRVGGEETLLDMEVEGQRLDNTVPLCGGEIRPISDPYYSMGTDVS
ncbi:mitogen-activated protein kinase kinase kinase 10 [Rhinophrynus dorsalis]